MPKYLIFLLPIFLLLGLQSFAQATTLPEGKIINKQGNTVSIQIEGDCPESQASEYTLEKHFTQLIFGAEATGWLSVAKVEIVNCAEYLLMIKIIDEQSEIIVNGEKVDHFKVGNVVKLADLKAPE